ncbi:hypothetical protein [Nonomuraea jabiensis]|uniref:hypothetical protein n=1 Tax=Nonomuraea jabiensis TaxID=882448 RepID=UPI0036934AFD
MPYSLPFHTPACHAAVGMLARFGYLAKFSPARYGVRSANRSTALPRFSRWLVQDGIWIQSGNFPEANNAGRAST